MDRRVVSADVARLGGPFVTGTKLFYPAVMLKIPNATLQKMQADGGFKAPNGEWVPTANSGGIAWGLCEALYETAKKYRPRKALEIGMASGYSTLAILTALHENADGGTLVSVDPYQTQSSRNAGRHHVEQAGFTAQSRVMEEPDYLALPRLVTEGQMFDLIYIDGNHDFEFVVLDYFYCDLLLNPGGIMAFNDCGWRSVYGALKHVPHRDRYDRVDVGLQENYKGGNIIATLERRLTGRSEADRYYRKIQKS